MSLHASQITVPVGTNVRALLVAMAALTVLSLPGLAPRAQQPAVVGGAGDSSVEVDLSVLDDLGAAPAIPGLLMPETNRRFGEKIILRPPGKTSAEKPAVPAPSPAPPKPASSKPAPAKATPAAPRQTAAVAPAPKSWGKGSTLRIAFDGDSAKLPDEAKADLEALARAFAEDSRLRLQVKAYAASTKDSASRARRLSLSRALSVRSYLIGQGLRSTRIEVRALGDKAEGGPADRADLLVVSRR